MSFVYTGFGVIRDEDRDIEIRDVSGFRDGDYTFWYQFAQGDFKFKFEFICSNHQYTYHTKTGREETGVVDDAVYIMEDSFRNGVQLAFRKLGKQPPTEEDYKFFKEIIAEGLTILITYGGETLQHIPGGVFRVEFEPNLPIFAAKYPDKIRGPNPWAPKNLQKS